jgi:ATP-dependent Clp protease protease subunit
MALPAIPQPDMYAVFAGDMNEEALQRFFVGLAPAQTTNVQRFHVLFQSNGGTVGHGIALYNFFQSLRFDVILYNCGIISSMGVIAYLGARKRNVSTHASFMIHHVSMRGVERAPATVLQALADAIVVDDRRTEAILRKHVTMPDDRWDYFNKHDLTLTAEDAVKYGFADKIAEFIPPVGSRLYVI